MSTLKDIIKAQAAIEASLRERLRKTALSSRALAREIGVSDPTIGLFLSGKRSPFPETLQKIEAWLERSEHQSCTPLPAQKLTPGKGEEVSP